MTRGQRFGIALLLAAAFVCASPARAQETSNPEPVAPPAAQNAPANAAPAHGESGEDETAQFKHSGSVQLISKITGLSADGAYWLAVVLNFAIVAGVIVWASRKNLPALFRSRTASIQKSIEEARAASEDARRRITEIEARLGRLDDEISAMRANSEKEAAAEEARIKASTEDELRRVVQSAEQEIESVVKSARRELTAYAADLAVALAAKQIHVDTATDQALVRTFSRYLSNGDTAEKSPGKKS
jgi:F-type H+-transporting ATPase subunit b